MNKLEWHERNIAFIERHAFTASRFPWSYLEVVAHEVPQSFGLLRRHLEKKSCFIGVNDDPRLVRRHPRGQKGTACGYQLICGDVFEIGHRLSKLANSPTVLKGLKIHKPVAAYNFDLQDSVGFDDFWAGKGELVYGIVRETHDRIPDRLCVVILNLCLNGWLGMRPTEALEKNVELFLERFGRDFTGLTREGLLGSKLRKLDEKGAYEQPLFSGAYEIYRQTSKSMPMATMRLCFKAGKAVYGSLC